MNSIPFSELSCPVPADLQSAGAVYGDLQSRLKAMGSMALAYCFGGKDRCFLPIAQAFVSALQTLMLATPEFGNSGARENLGERGNGSRIKDLSIIALKNKLETVWTVDYVSPPNRIIIPIHHTFSVLIRIFGWVASL